MLAGKSFFFSSLNRFSSHLTIRPWQSLCFVSTSRRFQLSYGAYHLHKPPSWKSCSFTIFTETIMDLVYPHKILHNHCFQFLLGITVVPREIEGNGYASFWGVNMCIHYSLGANDVVEERNATKYFHISWTDQKESKNCIALITAHISESFHSI